MRTKFGFLIAALLFAAFSQLRAELPAPLISVDTVFKIQTNGSKGAVFLPDGNSVIMMCQDTPYLIDAKTWQVIRQFEYKAGEDTESPVVSKDGKYLFARTNTGLAVWDIGTGKIIKYLRNCVDYCLSPDGTKLYQTIINDKNNTGVIRVYDMNTLTEIDVFCGHDFWGGEEIAISPDGQTLAVCVSHDPIGYEGDNINRSVILIDLKNKYGFTRIESMTPWITDMQFSPDGKNLTYKHTETKRYIAIYDLANQKMNYIYDSDMIKFLNAFFDFKHCGLGRGYFVNENTIEFNFGSYDEPVSYEIIWDITLNKVKNLIKYGAKTIDIKNNKILLCDPFGNLAQLDLGSISVKDEVIKNESYLQFSHNQLTFYSDKVFIGTSQVYDTTGKLISELGQQQFVIGNNTIRVNQTLPNGVYLLTIKNDNELISYKFIVE